MNYGVYILNENFFDLFVVEDYEKYNLKMKERRPYLIVELPDSNFPDCVCAIPFGSEKNGGKFKSLSQKHPDSYMPLNIEKGRDSFLMFQGYFYIKKKFVNETFIQNKRSVTIENDEKKKEIFKKLKRFKSKVKAMKKNKTKKFFSVDLDSIYKKQI